jgi:hypothetical protein
MDAISNLTKDLDEQCALQVLWFASSVGIKVPLAMEELQAYALLKDVKAKFPNSSRHLFTNIHDNNQTSVAAIHHWVKILGISTYTHLDVFSLGDKKKTNERKIQLFSLLSLQSLLVGQLHFSSSFLYSANPLGLLSLSSMAQKKKKKIKKGEMEREQDGLCQAAWPELFQTGWPKRSSNSKTGSLNPSAMAKKRKRMIVTARQEDKRVHILSVFNKDGTMRSHSSNPGAAAVASRSGGGKSTTTTSKGVVVGGKVNVNSASNHTALQRISRSISIAKNKNATVSMSVAAAHLSPRSKLSKEWRCWYRRVSSLSADQARCILQGEPGVDYWNNTAKPTQNLPTHSNTTNAKNNHSTKNSQKSGRKVATKRRLHLAP